MAEKNRVLTGARALFSIDGVRVGYARNVSIGEAVTYEPIQVLSNVETEEFIPTGYDVENFSASMFRIIGETIKSLGWFPSNGANTEEHLTNILTSGDLTASIEDTSTGKIFANVEQVKVQSHSFSIDARGVIGEDVNFVAIRLKDESEI
jgi:hypothetical protein